MSSHARKKPIRSRKSTGLRSLQQPDPYTSRILKTPSSRELNATLRHAVRNHDLTALEDYDEELRPPTNAVKDEPTQSLEDLLGDSYAEEPDRDPWD